MSNWLSLPILAIAAMLQATFMPQIRVFGGAPDLVFLCVLAWSVNAPLETAVAWSFAGGIIKDILSASPTGASTLGMLVLVFGITLIQRQIYHISLAVIAGLVLVGTLIQQVTLMLVLIASGFTINPFENFTYVILPTMAYNLLFIWPIYWLMRRLQKRFTKDSRAIA
jgi:rod shape-determining protein MreD